MTHANAEKNALRKQLRTTRRSLSPQQQISAANRLVRVLKPFIRKQKTVRIAAYYAMDGEIDLTPFMNACAKWKIVIYLPVLNRFRSTLLFAKYQKNTTMKANKFGIPEPVQPQLIRPWQINMVLLPLVGFDATGNRLGMGGGFYDRTFANAAQWPRQPKLIGVAHECQKTVKVPTESWDIPLMGIVSDTQLYQVTNKK